jgi:hypothetical protein
MPKPPKRRVICSLFWVAFLAPFLIACPKSVQGRASAEETHHRADPIVSFTDKTLPQFLAGADSPYRFAVELEKTFRFRDIVSATVVVDGRPYQLRGDPKELKERGRSTWVAEIADLNICNSNGTVNYFFTAFGHNTKWESRTIVVGMKPNKVPGGEAPGALQMRSVPWPKETTTKSGQHSATVRGVGTAPYLTTYGTGGECIEGFCPNPGISYSSYSDMGLYLDQYGNYQVFAPSPGGRLGLIFRALPPAGTSVRLDSYQVEQQPSCANALKIEFWRTDAASYVSLPQSLGCEQTIRMDVSFNEPLPDPTCRTVWYVVNAKGTVLGPSNSAPFVVAVIFSLGS